MKQAAGHPNPSAQLLWTFLFKLACLSSDKAKDKERHLDHPDCLTPDHPQQGDFSSLRGEVVHCIVEFAPGTAGQKSREKTFDFPQYGDEIYLARLRPDPLLLETLDLLMFMQHNCS